MRYYFAPMEGVTGYVFRGVHHRFFPGADKYFTPFLSPTQDHVFGRRELREIAPENNRDVPVVPQLMTRRGGDFVWAARRLADMGYGEVNLNLGCPSGTVVAKGKGSGMLGRLGELEELLDAAFGAQSIPISVKTRLGLTDPEEFGQILELFNRYPIAELILHPRIQKDFYKHPARREEFARWAPASRNSLCYNGDLFTVADCHRFMEEFPQMGAVMLGRGPVGDPGMLARLKGGEAAKKETLREFHNALYEGYAEAFGNRRNAMLRMKEYWFYHLHLYDENEKLAKKIRRATDSVSYENAVKELFSTLPLRADLTPGW